MITQQKLLKLRAERFLTELSLVCTSLFYMLHRARLDMLKKVNYMWNNHPVNFFSQQITPSSVVLFFFNFKQLSKNFHIRSLRNQIDPEKWK